MKKRILFGNNISNTGKTLSKNLGYFNFKVSCCGNTFRNIMKNLEADSNYEGLFFFVNRENDALYSFMDDMSKKFPHIKIYPLVSSDFDYMKEILIDCGAKQCFSMPINSEDLYFSVVHDFFNEDEVIVSTEISKFLVKHGFPTNVKGFQFVCISIETVIDDPKMFRNFSKCLYPYISEKTGSTIAWIERSIRNMSASVYKNGVRFERFPDDAKLTNKALIKLLADMYCEENNIKRNRDWD